jgi:PAS domain S-box-containing protein
MPDCADRRQYEDSLADRARHASLGAGIGAALTLGGTLHEMLQGCAQALVDNLDAAFARIWVLNREEDALVLHASAGIYTHLNGPHGRLSYSGYPYKIGIIAREKKPLLTNDTLNDPQISDKEWVKQVGLVSYGGYPLIVEDEILGVMAVFSRNTMSEATFGALASIADEVAVGIKRKQTEASLKDSEERFRSLVEESLAGAYIFQDGQFVYANPKLAEILGYTIEELMQVGSILDELAHPDDRHIPAGIIDRILSGKAEGDARFRGLKKDGSVFHVEVSAWGTMYKGRPAVIGTLVDITEQVRAEEERTGLFHMLTHDIKGPLTIITGYAELLKGKLEDKVAREMAESIVRASDRIYELICDMLAVTRAEAGLELKPEPVSVPDILRQAVKESEVNAQAHRIHLEVDASEGLPPVEADRSQLSRAVANLVCNAVKYNKDGGRVRVTAEILPSTSGLLRIEVADTGLGIPSEDIPHVFDKFYRGRNAGAKDSGTGLGLAIVRAVVKAHGGRVSVKSREGEGSIFSLCLPLRQAGAVEEKKDAEAA